MIARRVLGVAFASLAAIYLVAAGYYNAIVAGFPLMVVLIAAPPFFCEGGFSNLSSSAREASCPGTSRGKLLLSAVPVN